MIYHIYQLESKYMLWLNIIQLWLQILASAFTSKVFYFSETQFLHVQNETADNSSVCSSEN